MLPTRQIAEDLLKEAELCNPGPWGNHSRIAAHCAESIASYCDDLDVIKTTLSLYEKTSNEVLKSFSLLLSSSFYDEDLFLKKIQLFLNYKINLNSLHNGKTPLMYLCQNNTSTKAIQLLLKYGANNKIKSSENKTAFDYASENKSLQKDDIYWSLN